MLWLLFLVLGIVLSYEPLPCSEALNFSVCDDLRLLYSSTAYCEGPPCVSYCCIIPLEPWTLGYYRENFYGGDPFGESLGQSCDDDVFQSFKARSNDVSLALNGDMHGLDQIHSFPTRFMAFVGWNQDQVTVVDAYETAIHTQFCSPDATVKVGTPEFDEKYVRVPIVFQYLDCLGSDDSSQFSCAQLPTCSLVLETDKGAISFWQKSNDPVDPPAFASVMLWVKSSATWLGNNSQAFLDVSQTICTAAPNLCGASYNLSDPFSVCTAPWAQCLALADGTFNLAGADEQWVLSSGGEGLFSDANTTTRRAADMILGTLTHVALLLQAPDSSLLLPNNSLDLSNTSSVVLVALGTNTSFQIKLNSSALQAFVGINSQASLAPGVYPSLNFFSGTLKAGQIWPQMSNVKTLQVSNPQLFYQNPWVWSSKPTRQDFACTLQIQQSYSELVRPLNCLIQPAVCLANTICLNQSFWPALTNLAILGIFGELLSCFGNMPSVKQVFLDGSPLTNFSFTSAFGNIQALRLTNNPNLTSINSLSSNVTILHIYGNQKLVLPVFNPLQTFLVDIDFSLSAMFSPARFASSFAFLNAKKFRCNWCSLSSFSLSSLTTLFPNVTHLSLSHNQIDFDLSTYANTTQWKTFMEHVCVLNMSDNAIRGPLPVDFRTLIGGGCAAREEPQIDFNNNIIESFFSPPPLIFTQNINQDNLTDWLNAFQMFSPSFTNAIASNINNDSMPLLPQNKLKLWLSLKNNHLKGGIPNKLSASSVLGEGGLLIDLTYNAWWCDIFSSSCNGFPLVSTTLAYGDITEAQFFNNSTNVSFFSNSSASSLPPTFSISPFWPFSISLLDKQTLIISYFNPFLTPSGNLLTLFDDSLVETILWQHVNYKSGLITVALGLLFPHGMMSTCLSPKIRIMSSSDDILSSNSIYACRRAVSGTNQQGLTMFQTSFWLVKGCAEGRGYVATTVCDTCAKDTFSYWCANCLTPMKNLVVAATQSKCTPCPISQGGQSITVLSGAQSVSQCVCDIGSYGFPATLSVPDIPVITCTNCLDFAVCVTPNTTDPIPDDGYFQDAITKLIYMCDPAKACQRGVCTEGYDTASKCSACSPGYYRINRECLKCSKGADVSLAILSVFLFVALFILLKASKSDYTKIFTVSISLGYIQIISIFSAFPVTWPPSTQGTLNFLSFFNFNFDLASPECAVKTTYYIKWIMKMVLPLMAFGVLVIWYLVILYWPWMQNKWMQFVSRSPRIDRCLWRVMLGYHAKRLIETRALIQQEGSPFHEDLRQKEMEWERTHLKSRFIAAAISLASVGYTFVAKTATQPFNCLSTANTVFPHMRADPGVACYDDLWYSWISAAIFFIILYAVGIPVFFLTILVRAHRNRQLRTAEFLSSYGGLVLPFREQFWYWELIQLARKLTIVLLIDFKADNSDTSTFGQISGVLVVLILFFILQEFTRPYEFTWCNRLEFAWTGMSLLTLVGALVFSFDGALDPTQINAFAVFLVLALVAVSLMTAYTLFLEKRRVLVKVGLGSASYNKIEDDHKTLDAVFGVDLGDSVYRKTRGMSPEMRDEFFDRVSDLAGLSRALEMTKAVHASSNPVLPLEPASMAATSTPGLADNDATSRNSERS